MKIYWLVLGILGVWRITHLLSAEDGPWNVTVWVRRKAGSGFWGQLLDCFYCLSLWVAVPFSLVIGEGYRERLCLWLAFSAGAILVERATPEQPPVPNYFEHGGQDDAMLREIKKSDSGNDLQSKA
ncbi:MAG: DUF1360 domain-containing protein [Candidatus Sulfotelmatobacter sp.]